MILNEDGQERPGSPSRASAATGTCACPTSCGPQDSGQTDVAAFQLVTVGSPGRRGHRRAVRQANSYRDYLELHGLSVQLTEALAEYWHARVRAELGYRRRGPGRRRGPASRSTTAAAGTPSATRPARTWRTGPRSWSCSSPSGSGCELSEEFQLHPEQSTDAIVVAPPRGELLQHVTDPAPSPRTMSRCGRCCSTWTACSSTPSRSGSKSRPR